MSSGYYSVMRVTDFGPYITHLILPMGSVVTEQALSSDTFSVYAERLDKQGQVIQLPKSWMARDDREPSMGYIPVQKAYVSDTQGTPCAEGDCVTLCLTYGPTMQLASAICAPDGLNEYVTHRFLITQTAPIDTRAGKVCGKVYDLCLGRIQPDLDGWLAGKAEHAKLPIRYAYFVPETTQALKPLIVWLHGAGEGGQDVRIPFSANKVVAMATPRVQRCFDGAYVLVPQCDTFWMNDGSGQYTRTGKSMYAKALFNAIEYFVSRHTDIDRNRIYIGGDSNGGFMTMRMILDHPDYFAAAFPVCEALYDETISAAKLRALRHLPIWFVHAKNDPVVKPEDTVVPTYQRLKKLGAPVHFSFWDCIQDIHEGFRDSEGRPFEYLGHFAWIPLFNGDCNFDFDGQPVLCDGHAVDVLEWLSYQHK